MASSKPNTAKRTRQILTSGEDVRARVREMTLLVLDRELDVDAVKRVASDTMHAAAETIKGAVPEKQSSVLRAVFDGLTDAVDETARIAGDAVKEAKSRGKTLKDRDVARATAALKDVEEQFLSTVSSASGKFQSAARDELKSLVASARKAGDRIRPHVTGALKAADGRVIELAGEAAVAGAAVTRKAAAAALGAASGLLQGLSERLGTAPPKKKVAKKGTTRTAKKTSPARTSTKKPGATSARKPSRTK